ncbi:MAG: fumarylacetoacetate hydrolase family protein [Bacillota bacterium]|nr:fumarylacetoacetate hydrolase family protein [Bacillota bacterium]MDW7683656.1 fumarylacetoacetate hydrolase family protein [Bacillota bacterium]
MKWARFIAGGKQFTGYLDNTVIRAVKGDMFSDNWSETGETFFPDKVTFLAPCQPTKVVCIGLNYRDHAAEMKMDLPEEPIIFLKPPSSVIGHGGEIVHPGWIGRMDYEAELVAVIGRRTKHATDENAGGSIFGYTCGNDVTARSLQKKDGQWARAKSFDTFCPLGPWIDTELDAANAAISLDVNGELKQQSTTAQLVFNPAQLVVLLSRVMTLEPGDVILTGTPSGVGPLQKGDTVTVRIEGIGELVNSVT